jgi:hypothetical protein
MTKRKYFSWTDEKRAELKEFINTHDKKLPEAMKEAAVLFGVSIGSCYGAYRYEPQRPIVTEVDPSDLEPREGRTVKRKSKGRLMTIGELIEQSESKTAEMYMETEFDNMEAEKHPLEAEVERLEHELDEAYKQQEEMLEEIRRWVSRAIQGFSNIEMTAGGITLQDVDYHLNALVRVMKHQYGHKPKLVEE